MKWCIGEKIHNAYKIFVVAIPEDLNEYIRVSFIPAFCIEGTFYYNDNTAETRSCWEDEKKALTPEWAKKFISGYREGMKLMPVYAFYDHFHLGKRDWDEKANEKLRNKLVQMTGYDFYRKGY